MLTITTSFITKHKQDNTEVTYFFSLSKLAKTWKIFNMLCK